MSIVAEVSALCEIASLVAKIGKLCLEFKGFVHERLNVVEELKFWINSLEYLQIYAMDAENKQSNDEIVRKWLKDLEAMRLDIEDVITDLQYESMRRDASSNKISKFFKALTFGDQEINIFQTIKTRLQNMNQVARNLSLMPVQVSTSQASDGRSYGRSYGALKEEPILFGREEEKRSIVVELLSYNDGDPEIGVLPIVGMGGIGKTTIAQDVFNDERVKNFFEVRSWFGVSRDYNMFSIMKGLLDYIAGNPRNVSECGVQNQLMEVLKGKKFLIILDDLWNDNKRDWNHLMAALRGGRAGSKVIVTTRSRHVADMARTGEYWELEPVAFEDCWELFCSNAGVRPKGQLDARKEEAGKEIVRRCKGLPLAAAIFGGLLRNKQLHYWEEVRDKKLISKQGELDVMSVMKLSYNDLSWELKRCFALLAVFPEDYAMTSDDMMKLWLTEELIEWENVHVDRKNLDFAEELEARSLLTIKDYESDDEYVMHDMVRDFACELAGISCCVVDDNSINRIVKIYDKGQSRHLYFKGSAHSYAKLVEHVEKDSSVLRTLQLIIHDTQSSEKWKNNYFSKLKYLRSLYCEGIPLFHDAFFQKLKYLKILYLISCKNLSLSSITKKLKLLEMLHISNCEISDVPHDIGNLKKLKVLNLRKIGWLELPVSITLMENLEYFDIEGAYALKKLPLNIGNLKKLKILDLSETGISELPVSITMLENLEELHLTNCPIDALPPNLETLQNLKIIVTDQQRKQFLRQFPSLCYKTLEEIVEDEDDSIF